ncbi:MAG: hypothetical protein ACKV0T_28990 [Planctomycetales bacterium]
MSMRTPLMIGCFALVASLLPVGLAAQDASGEAPAASPPAAQPAPAAMTPPTLAAVVEHLSAESRRKFGDLLAADWKDRPEWADMLIGLLQGGGMGPGAGWFKPSQKRYDWKWLAERYDLDSDGSITPDELVPETGGSEALFTRLDRDYDGRLRPVDFEHFGRQQATPPLMMSQFLTSLFDTDTNGRITPDELESFLKRTDADQTGFLTADDLLREFTQAFSDPGTGGNDMPRPDRMLPMFFRGEFGVLEPGPALGDEAPDFTLPTHDGSRVVTLKESRGKPVILIFGSFT